ASRLSPRSSQPLLNLASLQIQAADVPGSVDTMIARALATLAKALEIRPTSALAHCLSGAANAKINAYEKAKQDFKRAIDLEKDFGVARLMLANLYIHQENWDAAVESLESYLEDSPGAPDRPLAKSMLEDIRSKVRSKPKE